MLGIALSFLTGGLSKLLDIAKRVPWWAWVAVAALFVGWRVHAGVERRAYDDAFNRGFTVQQARIDQWKAASKINLASIGTLEAALRAKNAESDARAAALTASHDQNARDNAAADARQKADAGRQQQLQGIAEHAAANPTCRAPEALTANLEGL